METRVRYVAPVSCGIVFAAVYLVLGIVEAAFILAVGLTAARIPFPVEPAVRTTMLVVTAVGMTVGAALFGFLFGLLGAIVYNLVAAWTGGLRIRVDAPIATGTVPLG